MDNESNLPTKLTVFTPKRVLWARNSHHHSDSLILRSKSLFFIDTLSRRWTQIFLWKTKQVSQLLRPPRPLVSPWSLALVWMGSLVPVLSKCSWRLVPQGSPLPAQNVLYSPLSVYSCQGNRLFVTMRQLQVKAFSINGSRFPPLVCTNRSKHLQLPARAKAKNNAWYLLIISGYLRDVWCL